MNNGDGSRILNAWPTGLSQLAAPLSLKVNQLTFTGADVRASGGAIQTAGDIQVFESKFIDNVALGPGGAISVRVPAWVQKEAPLRADVVNCQFVRNIARVGNGGALAVEDNAFFEPSATSVSGSTFVDNESRSDGGGVYIAGRMQSIEFTASKFQGNFATNGGGSFIQSYGELVVDACEVIENYARDAGGGVSAGARHTIILDTLVHSNQARKLGGGLTLAGDVMLINSTISQNTCLMGGTTSDFSGGGGIASWGSLKVRNSTIVQNTVGSMGPAVVFRWEAELRGRM